MTETPEPEFDEQTTKALARLTHKLAHNKETRRAFSKLVRQVEPERAAAFVDVTAEERIEELEERQAKKELEREQREIEKRLTEQRHRLIKTEKNPDGQYTEDEVKEIEGVMTRYGLSDYDPAVVLYAHERPPASPQPPEGVAKHGATWEFPDFKAFVGNPTGAARDRAHEVISEITRNRSRR